MTGAKVQLTISQVVQIIAVVATIGSAGLFIQFQGTATAEEVAKLKDSDATIRSRTRALEVIAAEGNLIHDNVEKDLDDIKDGQKRTNDLLIQLLQQGTAND